MKDPAEILILYTGGTIGMCATERGYAPKAGFLANQISSLPQFHDSGKPLFTTPPSRFGRRVHFDIKEYDPLLDSSNMGMEDWIRIASDIEEYYKKYNAFIILHGTDTMAYTASALSFMLEGLRKPVILTGSQIPLSETRNDAVDNVLGALTIAGHYELPEVCLYFSNKLLRGNRSQKRDASALDAFDSANFPPLVEVGVDIKVRWDAVLSPADREFAAHKRLDPQVATLRLFPGIPTDIITNYLRPPLKGLVLETYGTGNAPDRRKDLLEALREANERGVVIVNCTQCTRGMVTADYATGAALAAAGVVPGADLTVEAALTKMSYLFGKGLPPAEVRRQMQASLRGELTETAPKVEFSLRERAFVKTVARALRESNSASDTSKAEDDVRKALLPVLLCSAAALGDCEGLRGMLDDGAPVDLADYDGRTALHLSAAEGKLEAVRLLIERGAQVNCADRWGGTPLSDAVSHGHDEVAAFLKQQGGKLRQKDLAVLLCTHGRAGDVVALRQLLDAGADPSMPDYDGRTALHMAAAEGKLDAVAFLIERGARVDARDRWGGTPLHDAKRHKHEAVIELLSAY